MPSVTKFNTKKQHIYTRMRIHSNMGGEVAFTAIVDTGAPITELSDRSLARVGFKATRANVETKDLQETQKYGKVLLPKANLLGQQMDDWVVYISRFHESWGIDALIGLDFIRRFKTTIDYHRGEIVTQILTY